MLPNSHAWKMLCRLYGLLLKEEWARRLAERCAFPVFLSSASKVREIWTNLLRRPASIDACLLRCGCGGRVAGRAGLIDMLERRVMLSGDTLQTATPLIFQETPAAPGYSWAYVSDSIDLATDVDYWAIDVFANDGISLMVESQTGLNAHLELRNSADGVLRSDADSGPGTDPMIVDYVAPTTGRIYARVSGAGLGDYTLRVDRGRAFALESDAAYSNNTLANANPLELRASGVNTVAQVAGVVMASEGSTADVDTYLIGYLKTGSTVTLTLNYPDGSTLSGTVQLLDDAGKVVAEGPDGSLTRLLSADGRYYARVLANSGSGIYGSYILDLSVADRTFPQVVAVNGLPVPGGISDVPLYRFDVVVDKELAADSVRGDAFELRHAGADGQFGDADDVLYTVSLRQPYERGNTIELIIDDGPLPHGKYRLQISSSITDVTGNALDGNRDGNGGDAYVHEFSLDLPADDQQSTFIGSGGTTRDTAVALPLMPDASVPELLLGKAVGVVYPAVYQDYWRDSDWWQIQLEAGDRVSIRVDSIDVQLDPYVALTRANGSELRSNDNAGPGNGAFISSYSITESGTYYVHVGKYTLSTSSGMYRLRVDVARGLPMESDAEYGNDSMGGANGLTLVQDGSLRKGSIIGLIMAGDSSNTDDDYFSLGQLTGGNTVQLWLERPASSTLDGVVRLRDSLGRILPDEDGNSADDRLTATLTSDGVYYVEVLAASGAGTSGYYLLHAQVGDTLGPWVAGIDRIPEQFASEQIYQQQVRSTDPLLYYMLNESYGTTVYDVTGNLLHGVYEGDPRFGSDGAFGSAYDNSVHLDGNAYISVNDPRLDLRREVSFSFWLNVDSYTNSWTPLICKSGGNANSRTYSLWLQNNGTLRVSTADGSNEYRDSASGVITLGTWHHVAGVIDRVAGEIRLYVDGRRVISGAVRKTDAATTSDPLTIGWTTESGSTNGKLNGRIDDLAIYDRAMTEGALLKPYWMSKGQGSVRSTDQLRSTWSVTFSEKLLSSSAGAAGNYELIGAGADGVFGTGDDEVWNLTPSFDGDRTVSLTVVNGPLTPGRYRFRILPGVTDVLGNALDGNADGTGGDAWVRYLTISPLPPDAVPEASNNDTLQTAMPVVLGEDPANSGFLIARIRGSIDPAVYNTNWNDIDWYSISLQGGDILSISMDSPDGQLNPYLALCDSTGKELLTDDDGGPENGAFISGYVVPSSGTYHIKAGKSRYSSVPGNYDLRVEVVRGIGSESDREYDNNTLAKADPVTYTGDETRTATIAGTLMAGQSGTADQDYFDLGIVESGKTILLSTRLPESSLLRPIVEIRDSSGRVVSIATNPSDAVARADISTTGRYYALVLASEGHGTYGQYLLDVAIQPTSDLNFADLVVSEVKPIAGGESGGLITVEWTVGNFGAVATPTSTWIDRIVLSLNNKYGDADDIQLHVSQHDGVLGVGETYTATAQVRLPVGISGSYYVLVATDATGVVSEFIFEANNATSITDPFTVTLTPYADLTVTSVALPERIIGNEQFNIEWTVENRGTGTTGTGRPGETVASWIDRIIVSSNSVIGDADDRVIAEIIHTGTLGSGASYIASYTGMLPADLTLEGDYHLFVVTDAAYSVYEYTDIASNTFQTERIEIVPRRYADLTVEAIAIAPDEGKSGEAINVTYTVRNSGIGAATGGWVDRVYLSTDGAIGDDILLGTFQWNSSVLPGGEYTNVVSVTLPERISGNYRILVVTDGGSQVYEYKFETNNARFSGVMPVIRRDEADLAVAITDTIAQATWGEQVIIGWTVTNIGLADTRTSWVDRVYLSADEVLDSGDTLLATQSGEFLQKLTGNYTRTASFAMPSRPAGNWHIIVKTDYNDAELEPNELNNIASFSFTMTSPDLAAQEVRTASADFAWGDSLDVQWVVRNLGSGAALSVWSDRLYLSADTVLDGSDIELGTFARPGESLASGGEYLQAHTVKTELSWNLPEGTYYLLLRTDALAQQAENDEGNNIAVSAPITFTMPALPDIVVESVRLDNADVKSGDTILLKWIERNLGTAAVAIGTSTRVRVTRADDSSIAFDRVFYFDTAANSSLVAGGEALRQVSFALPEGPRGAGEFKVQITADYYKQVFEHNAAGDAEANNIGQVSFTASLAGYPDLIASVSVAAGVLESGKPMTIQWEITNRGDAPAVGSFSHRLQVTNATTGASVYSKVYRYDVEAGGAIQPGGSRQFEQTITLPDGTLGSGELIVRVTADHYNDIYEYTADGMAELNNQAEVRVVSELADYPDLQVAAVQPAGGNFRPSEVIEVSWILKNTGGTDVSGGISEKVFLASAPHGGTRTLLAVLSYTDTILANSQVQRSALVKLPAYAAGENWIIVQTDSAGEVYELNEDNNTASAAAPISIQQGLSMSTSKPSVAEGGSAIAVTLGRNGPTTDPLVVTIANSQPGMLVAPGTVTIPAGSSTITFLVTPVNNDQVDGDAVITLSASAEGYVAAEATVRVADDDVPTLRVQVSPDPVSELAGEQGLNIRVWRNTAPEGDLLVFLASSDENRIRVPYSVVIPDGHAYVDVYGAVKDNIYIDGEQSIRITAAAEGYVSSADQVAFVDDDVPMLSLSAEASTISEAAGAYATVVTVTRSTATPIDVYVQLTGAAGQLLMPAYVKIPAYQKSASFTIGTINNNDVSGDRPVTITARVVDSFTQKPQEAGKSTLVITITEDDGPVLSMSTSSTSIREDSTGTITIRRNTGSTGDLWVDLVSSDTSAATVPARVLIPDGADSVTATVSAVPDSAVNGTRNVTISASAFGYGGSSVVISITEGDLPDLVVSDIFVPATGETGELVTISYTVENRGIASAVGSWNDRVYISEYPVIDSRATLLRTFTRNVALGAGGSYTNSFDMSLPNSIGRVYIMVQTETLGAIDELKEGNNSRTSSSIHVSPAYSATVRVSQDVYGAGQPVLLHGVATRTKTGEPAAYEFVTVHVRVNGTVRTITAFTAEDGSYQAIFRPLATEAGNYEVGATHPGVAQFDVQARFAIAGMKADGARFTVTPHVAVIKTLTVTNRSSVPITGLNWELVGVPDGMMVEVAVPETLPGNGSVTLTYTVEARNPDLGEGTLGLRLRSDQGAMVDIPITVNVVPLSASLVVNPTSLEAGMVRGERKTLDIAIRNIGSAPSGEISILLPEVNWMRLVSPEKIASLAPGEYAMVTLELCPPEDLPLQLYQGQIVVTSANGASRNVGFSFRALSLATGDARFTVTDDYTYYVEGQPKVENATVTLSDPITGDVVATAKTGPDGVVELSNLPEGAYQLEVYAPKHGTYRSRFDVLPGVVKSREVFIKRQLVSYNWTVVPVELQDTYKIVLEPTFETNVPVPVVVVENPEIMPVVFEDQWSQFMLRMTNHGLIAAEALKITVPQSDFYEVEVLVSDLGDIPAKTTIEIPCRIRAKTGTLEYQRTIARAQSLMRQGDLAGAEALLKAQGCNVDSGIPCMPKLPIEAAWMWVCVDGNWERAKFDLAPVCAAKSVYDCLQQVSDSAAKAFSNSDLRDAPCALVSAFLQCAAEDIDDCTKAMIKATCEGIMGAVVGATTGGWAGAAKGLASGLLGAAGNLLSCLCNSLNSIDWDIGDVTETDPSFGGLGGWGLNTGRMPEFPFTSPFGGTFGFGECGPYPQGMAIPSSTGEGVCARVRLQIEQQAVLTRTGFAGTFQLENETVGTTLEGIRVDIDIRDLQGNPANHLFGYRDPEVDGMGNVSGSGVLAGGQVGTARWLFVPTRDAAPQVATGYSIGGTLRYIENGQEVVVPLLPATITVYPDPQLSLDYFLQKDVYSDDPFTEEVEPAVPFVLGLLVSNTGADNARNFSIASGQPKIIENEKGLLIDFKIIGTQVGTQEKNPSLTANFGTISAGGFDSAVWYMTSTLQGNFIEYDASFTHVDDFGNPRTSLIDRVTFHELIHALKVDASGYADDGRFDFLANDVDDPDDLPDVLYESTAPAKNYAIFPQKTADRETAPAITPTIADPGLAAVVNAWPSLPETLRQRILGLAEAGVMLAVGAVSRG